MDQRATREQRKNSRVHTRKISSFASGKGEVSEPISDAATERQEQRDQIGLPVAARETEPGGNKDSKPDKIEDEEPAA